MKRFALCWMAVLCTAMVAMEMQRKEWLWAGWVLLVAASNLWWAIKEDK